MGLRATEDHATATVPRATVDRDPTVPRATADQVLMGLMDIMGLSGRDRMVPTVPKVMADRDLSGQGRTGRTGRSLKATAVARVTAAKVTLVARAMAASR